MGGLGRGHQALPGQCQLVDSVLTAGVVLDRAARKPGAARLLDRVRHALGLVGESVLQIGRHREVGAVGQRGGVLQGLVTRDATVEAAEGGGVAAAGRGQRLEPERGEQCRRAEVPGVGHQQRIASPVQCQEALGLLLLGDARAHCRQPTEAGLRVSSGR